MTVTFESPRHKALHDVLIEFGFCFEVTSDRLVCSIYRHPNKPFEAVLTDVEGDWWAITRDLSKPVGEQINTETCFSELEWDWMDAADSEVEFLKRELHVLLQVRPGTMTEIC